MKQVSLDFQLFFTENGKITDFSHQNVELATPKKTKQSQKLLIFPGQPLTFLLKRIEN